jgi:hypothetical protein
MRGGRKQATSHMDVDYVNIHLQEGSLSHLPLSLPPTSLLSTPPPTPPVLYRM